MFDYVRVHAAQPLLVKHCSGKPARGCAGQNIIRRIRPLCFQDINLVGDLGPDLVAGADKFFTYDNL